MIRKVVLVLSLGFAIFISLFALDVIGQERWFLALVIHLIPTFMVIILTVISWKKEFLGAILWLILAIFFIIMSPQAWIIYIPAMVIGGLNIWLSKFRKLV